MDDDALDCPPSVSKFTAWFFGGALPACLAAYAISGLITEAVYLPGRRGAGMTVKGDLAVWLSLAYLSLSAVFHFHLFWGSQGKLFPYRYILVLISLISFCVCLGGFVLTFLSRW